MLTASLKRIGIASAKQNVIRHGTRNFQVSSSRLKASFFNMPAMSPTMTEGGVVSWKFKPGEKFDSGEVLLEVETDKATIDVETLDEGVLWEILSPEGSTGIPVGQPIALLAEVGDDLATLERPEIVKKAAAPKEEAKEEVKEEVKEAPKDSSDKESSATKKSASVFQAANPKQKLFPSVELLLQIQNITHEEAIEKIPATGPNGRLLKGDVLAYVGSITKDWVSTLTSFLTERQHLDFSKVVVATPEEAHKLAQKETPVVKKEEDGAAAAKALEEKAAAAAAAAAAQFVTISVPVDAETLEDIDLFVRFAVNDAYAAKFPQFEYSPSGSNSVQTQDEIFDELLAAPVTQKRFEVVGVKVLKSNGSPSVSSDPFDDLLGLGKKGRKKVSKEVGEEAGQHVEVTLKLNNNVSDAKEFAARFEESLRGV